VKPRVLLVDDELHLLDGCRRHLEARFEVTVAANGDEALALLDPHRPYAVVVSGFEMPGMDGVRFLSEVATRSPDSTRIMLTGQTDITTTIASINRSKVFRFLTKPCPPHTLAAALADGVEQFHLMRAERQLLEQTLQGTVEVLVEVLGLVDPDAQHASARLRDRVRSLCDRLDIHDTWQFELAAMLSQLGTIALPPEAVARFRTGDSLNQADRALLESHPQSAYHLLVKIPRLELVARMVLAQERPPMSRPLQPDDPDDDDLVAIGAHLLNATIEFDRLRSRMTPQEAIGTMRRSGGPSFRIDVLEALAADAAGTAAMIRRRLPIDDLEPGQILDEDVATRNGLLLLAKGRFLTGAHIQHIRQFASSAGVPEPVEVLVKQ
jgi:CheY-like chemotaxis protein